MRTPLPTAPALCWEAIACPLCGATDEEELLAVSAATQPGSYRLVRCHRCAMGYLNPRPDAASIGHFYPKDYGPYQARDPRSGWGGRLSRWLNALVLSYRYGYPPPLTHRWQKLVAAVAQFWF